jgi:hypothetical protein
MDLGENWLQFKEVIFFISWLILLRRIEMSLLDLSLLTMESLLPLLMQLIFSLLLIATDTTQDGQTRFMEMSSQQLDHILLTPRKIQLELLDKSFLGTSLF